MKNKHFFKKILDHFIYSEWRLNTICFLDLSVHLENFQGAAELSKKLPPVFFLQPHFLDGNVIWSTKGRKKNE